MTDFHTAPEFIAEINHALRYLEDQMGYRNVFYGLQYSAGQHGCGLSLGVRIKRPDGDMVELAISPHDATGDSLIDGLQTEIFRSLMLH